MDTKSEDRSEAPREADQRLGTSPHRNLVSTVQPEMTLRLIRQGATGEVFFNEIYLFSSLETFRAPVPVTEQQTRLSAKGKFFHECLSSRSSTDPLSSPHLRGNATPK